MNLKLNLGCNDLRLDGFVNIDIDPNVKPDLVADVTKLPYEDDSVDAIYAGHVLEHLFDLDIALAEWKRVLVPRGTLVITVPDIEKGLRMFEQGQIPYKLLLQIVFGSAERIKQLHWQVFTTSYLKEVLAQYFPIVVEIEETPFPSLRVEWQTTMRCQK